MSTKCNPPGKLVMASNSLGLAVDIPARSLAAVKDADLVVFEEDRGGRAVLKAAGIHRDYLRYSEHNQIETLENIVAALRDGKTVAYLSDQGCPGLADPGRAVVTAGNSAGATLTSVPGPSALTAAIAVCPFDLSSFYFAGFPPRDPGERQTRLQHLATLGQPVILMDTPYRMRTLLAACCTAWGDEHPATIAIDISGSEERNTTGPLAKLAEMAAKFEKLNFVLIIERGKQKSGGFAPRAEAPQGTGTKTRPPVTARQRNSRHRAVRR
jgi:16S rRNA (cytidine1402-2'-O)-methyltransferase